MSGNNNAPPKTQFWKSVRYVVFFYAVDKASGYRELSYTAIYECVDTGMGYAEFTPIGFKQRKMEKLFPELICEITHDHDGNEVAIDTDYDQPYYPYTDIEIFSDVYGY